MQLITFTAATPVLKLLFACNLPLRPHLCEPQYLNSGNEEQIPRSMGAQSVNVKEGTPHWLKYATKGAMADNTRLIQDLGRYYLAFHGWYPKRFRPQNPLDIKIGFAWLELPTMFLEVEPAAQIWAGMALLLREHGDRAGGMEYLQQGLKQIEAKLIPEDDVKGAERKERALTELRHLIKGVESQDYGQSVEDRSNGLCPRARCFLHTIFWIRR